MVEKSFKEICMFLYKMKKYNTNYQCVRCDTVKKHDIQFLIKIKITKKNIKL